MFDLTAEQVHWIPVRWSVLQRPADGGEALSTPTEAEIELEVELVDRDEVMELFPNFFATDDAETKQLDIDDQLRVFNRLVKRWRKVAANGRAVEMNEENVRRLLKVPMFPAAFANAYMTALGGIVEIREGNSAPSLSVGRGERGRAAGTKS